MSLASGPASGAASTVSSPVSKDASVPDALWLLHELSDQSPVPVHVPVSCDDKTTHSYLSALEGAQVYTLRISQTTLIRIVVKVGWGACAEQ